MRLTLAVPDVEVSRDFFPPFMKTKGGRGGDGESEVDDYVGLLGYTPRWV